MFIFTRQCDSNLAMWQKKVKELKSRAVVDGIRPSDMNPFPSDSSVSSLPTSPPDVSTMFALSLPPALYPLSEARQPTWPASNACSYPLSMTTRVEMEDSAHGDARVHVRTPPDSIPPSPPNSAMQKSHRQHPSHTHLPQVCIPMPGSTPFSPSNSQHIKSSSTTSASASSPLFSPRSIPTSSSSPRSDISCAGSGTSAVPSPLGWQFRPGLRAAYDANGRSKPSKRLENRTSWQGAIAVTTTALSGPTTAQASDTMAQAAGS